MKSLLILGAGGFGRMVAETAQALGYEKVVFLDDAVKDEAVIGMCCDYEIRHKEYPVAVAAFGNNKMRLYWTDKLLEKGMTWVEPKALARQQEAEDESD